MLATLLGALALGPATASAGGSMTAGQAAAAELALPAAPGWNVAAPMLSLDGAALREAAMAQAEPAAEAPAEASAAARAPAAPVVASDGPPNRHWACRCWSTAPRTARQ